MATFQRRSAKKNHRRKRVAAVVALEEEDEDVMETESAAKGTATEVGRAEDGATERTMTHRWRGGGLNNGQAHAQGGAQDNAQDVVEDEEDGEEEEGEEVDVSAMARKIKDRRNKRKRSRKSMARPTRIYEHTGVSSAASAGATAYGSRAGEYTADRLRQLRQETVTVTSTAATPFQVHANQEDGDAEDAMLDELEGATIVGLDGGGDGGTLVPDKETVRQLKAQRARRQAVANGEYIPLHEDGQDGEPEAAARGGSTRDLVSQASRRQVVVADSKNASRLVREDDDDEDVLADGYGTGQHNVVFMGDVSKYEVQSSSSSSAMDVDQGRYGVPHINDDDGDEDDDDLGNTAYDREQRAFERAQLAKVLGNRTVSSVLPSSGDSESMDGDDGSTHRTGVAGRPGTAKRATQRPAHLPPDEHAFGPAYTVEDIQRGVLAALTNAQERYDVHRVQLAETRQKLGEVQATLDSVAREREEETKTKAFYEAMHQYVYDLVECLHEKAPVIEEIEVGMQELARKEHTIMDRMRRELTLLVLQRCEESVYGAARTEIPGDGGKRLDEFGRDTSLKRKQHRQSVLEQLEQDAAREGYESVLSLLLCDWSTLEAHMANETASLVQEREALQERLAHVFDDAADEFSQLGVIKGRFEAWKATRAKAYADAYAGMSVPTLVAPYVRQQMALWNPLQDEPFFEMPWHAELWEYGNPSTQSGEDDGQQQQQQNVGEDDVDRRLIPNLVENVVLPRVSFALQHIWDPMSVAGHARARDLLHQVQLYVPAQHAAYQGCISIVVQRVRDTLDQLCFPVFVDVQGGVQDAQARQFQDQHVHFLIALLSALCAWHELLPRPALMDICVARIMSGMLAPYMAACCSFDDLHAIAEACIHTLPDAWLHDYPHGSLPGLGAFHKAIVDDGVAWCEGSNDRKVQLGQLLLALNDESSASRYRLM